MKRFKTKQEFANTSAVGQGFGSACDYFGEPACNAQNIFVDEAFTTDPHPYAEKAICISGHKGKMRKTLQEKAFALGYRWVGVEDNTGTEVIRDECEILYLYQDKHLTRSTFDLDDKYHDDYTKLTPEQFMGGDLPVEEVNPYHGMHVWIEDPGTDKKDVTMQERAFELGYKWDSCEGAELINRPHQALQLRRDYLLYGPGFSLGREAKMNKADMVISYDDFMNGICETPAEPKKLDAYIDTNNTLHAISGDQHFRTGVQEAWKYNLMSEEAFKEKHPDQLKFKEWEVTLRNASVKIGCETFSKQNLKIFSKLMQKLNTHKVDAKEFYAFLYCNKEKLGLDF